MFAASKEYGLHSRDGPNRKSLAVEYHSIWKVSKGLGSTISVPSRCLNTSKLNGKGRSCLAREGLGGCVKGDRPIVDVGVVRVRPDGVCLAAKDTPVHVVEIGGDIALTHVKLDAVGEVLGKIVDRPVEAVLVRRVGARRVPGAAVPELAAAPVGSADAPELRAGGLGDPGRRRLCGGACLHYYAVLCVLSKDAVAVDG